MSCMGPEPAECRERRRLFMRVLRELLHGIQRAPLELVAVGDERGVGLNSDGLSSRRRVIAQEVGGKGVV
jgi:hypothetical protein